MQLRTLVTVPAAPALQRRTLRPTPARRQQRAQAFFGKLFGGSASDQDASMGSSGSKGAQQGGHGSGWQPGTPGQERKYSKSGHDITPLTTEERIAAAKPLTDFQRHVTLQAGTERAFTGKTVDGSPHDNKRKGIYVSAVGGLPLFSSEHKYDSGTGWPSFSQPLDPEHVVEVADSSIPFMPRVEVLCARSGAHLGHVFTDGPRPTGMRYCMNAAALRFIPEGEELPPESRPARQQ